MDTPIEFSEVENVSADGNKKPWKAIPSNPPSTNFRDVCVFVWSLKTWMRVDTDSNNDAFHS